MSEVFLSYWPEEEPWPMTMVFGIERYYLPFHPLAFVVLGCCLWGVLAPGGRRRWKAFSPWGWYSAAAILVAVFIPTVVIILAVWRDPSMGKQLSGLILARSWLFPLLRGIYYAYVVLSCALILPLVFLWLARRFGRDPQQACLKKVWLALFILSLFGYLLPAASSLVDAIQETQAHPGNSLSMFSEPFHKMDEVLELVASSWFWAIVRLLLLPSLWICVDASLGVGGTLLALWHAPRRTLARAYAWILAFFALSLLVSWAAWRTGWNGAPLLGEGLLLALSIPALLGLRHLLKGVTG